MKNTVNSYFAVLLIVIAGAAAGMLIYRLATTDILVKKVNGSEKEYAPLKESILGR